MNQFHLILLIFVATHHFGFSECRRMLWNQRTNFVDATNWEGDTLPCSTDTVVFPHKSYDYIKLSNFTMKEIILPKSGGFVLSSQASISFRERDSQCAPNNTRTYKSVIQTPWLSSSNWLSARDPNQNDISVNAATPHDERVPCDNDEIIFPINNSYVVDLQSIPILSFKSIAIDGRVMSVGEFKDFLLSVHGQSAFKNTENTLFVESSCFDEGKCACHSRGESLREQLCENERPFCQTTPHCSDPIKPIGHCCFECGAMFHMSLNRSKKFDLKSFKDDVQKAIDAAGSATSEKVIYHIGVTSSMSKSEERRMILQLVIVDRYEYNEHSTRLMEHLRKTVLNQSKFYFVSGLPFTPNESSHVFAFIFGTFFLVTLFMTLIYIGYYDDRHIPRLMALIRNRQHNFMRRSSVIFARFDNASNANATRNVDGDDGESVVEVDLHFATDQSIENVNRAFNNPMFGVNISKRRDQESDVDDDTGGESSQRDEAKIEEAKL